MPYPSHELALELEQQGLVRAHAVHGRLDNIGPEKIWTTIYPAPGHKQEVIDALRVNEVPFLEEIYRVGDGGHKETRFFCPLR